MTTGLWVDVTEGSANGVIFHPTLPFSYEVGIVYMNQEWNEKVNNFTVEFESPIELIKPWFQIVGKSYIGAHVVEKVAGTTKTYKLTAERYITNIHPRTGQTWWSGEGLPLWSENPGIRISDIRG